MARMADTKAAPRLVSVGVDIDAGCLQLWIDRGLKGGKLDCVPLSDDGLLEIMTEGCKHLRRSLAATPEADHA